jgi:hypothetical protein
MVDALINHSAGRHTAMEIVGDHDGARRWVPPNSSLT